MIFLLSFPLRDSQQRRKNKKNMILGDIDLAFQNGVPAGRFSLKVKNNATPLLVHIELAFPLGDSQQEKITTTGRIWG